MVDRKRYAERSIDECQIFQDRLQEMNRYMGVFGWYREEGGEVGE